MPRKDSLTSIGEPDEYISIGVDRDDTTASTTLRVAAKELACVADDEGRVPPPALLTRASSP